MLTKNGIKKFCMKSIGIFVVNPKEDFVVERYHDSYVIKVFNARAPKHIIMREWARFSDNTKYKYVQIEVESKV
jgi:hypothetical protein